MDGSDGAAPARLIEHRAAGTAGNRDRCDERAYLAALGSRVRTARAVRGLSRKGLAARSGISERYIAQLEGGQGNVSIVLLRRVAAAIGARLADLVADPAASPPDWPVIRDLLGAASPAQIAEARAALSGPRPPEPGGRPADRVALIGLRGAGKSTLGLLAAARLGWPFIEMNREIERETGLRVAEIHALYGPEAYRRFEGACLRALIGRPGPMIVATGGGLVAEPLTFELLLSAFFTVRLLASPEEHMERVRGQGDLRPMADDRAAMRELRAILHGREPLYARADAAVDTSGRTAEAAADALTQVILDRGGRPAPGSPLAPGHAEADDAPT